MHIRKASGHWWTLPRSRWKWAYWAGLGTLRDSPGVLDRRGMQKVCLDLGRVQGHSVEDRRFHLAFQGLDSASVYRDYQ